MIPWKRIDRWAWRRGRMRLAEYASRKALQAS